MINPNPDLQLLEAQILFSVITNPKWVDELKDLNEKDFLHFKETFKAIKKLYEQEITIDYGAVLSLTPQVKEVMFTALQEDNFGFSLLPLKKIFKERLSLFKELSVKREVEESMINELDLEILKEKLEQIYKKGLSRWLTAQDLKNLAYEILANKKEASVLYYLSLLDKTTGGIEKGQYIIIAGRPSVGKSALLQYIALKNAEKGKKVLFVSVEMSEEMIVSRILKTYKPETIPATFNILIAGDTQTIEAEIREKARDFDLVLIDYIQLLRPRTKTKDMYERITFVSEELKKIATKFNLPLVCASQFSRKAEKQQPTLADLKESGALEQDADVVISLWKDDEDEDLLLDENLVPIRVDLLKNRNGRTFSNSDNKDYQIMFKRDEFRFFDVKENL